MSPTIDRPAFEVADMGLGQVIVGADGDDQAVEEVLGPGAQMDAQAGGDVVGFTDIGECTG